MIAMRRSTALFGMAVALGLALGWPVQARGDCRYECDLNLQQCRQSCVDAQSFDTCTSDCESAYQQCVMSCA